MICSCGNQLKENGVIDIFPMSTIAIANKPKHPNLSPYVELVFKDGKKLKYIDRANQYKAQQLFDAVDAINAQL